MTTERKINFLIGYVCLLTTACAGFAIHTLKGSASADKARFREIDVERLNVIEKNGRPRFIFSNEAQDPGWIVRGKEIPGRAKRARMLFFNDDGEEAGALAFSGQRGPDGVAMAGGGLLFDKYDGDQLLWLVYEDFDAEKGKVRAGLTIRDIRQGVPTLAEMVAPKLLPDGAERAAAQSGVDAKMKAARGYGAHRLFVGRDLNGDALVRLSDAQGKPRLCMKVDNDGHPSIEFLDAAGGVISRITGETETGASR